MFTKLRRIKISAFLKISGYLLSEVFPGGGGGEGKVGIEFNPGILMNSTSSCQKQNPKSRIFIVSNFIQIVL